MASAKELSQSRAGAEVIVHRFADGAPAKVGLGRSGDRKEEGRVLQALDAALKALSSHAAALVVSVDGEAGRVTVLAAVSKAGTANGLKASEWVAPLAAKLGGKGGGREASAQASGPNVEAADEVLQMAEAFATAKLA